jgi:hypothetical protein
MLKCSPLCLYSLNLSTFWLKIEQFKVSKFELYKHNDELFNIYYGIFYELWTFTEFDRLCKLEKRGDEIKKIFFSFFCLLFALQLLQKLHLSYLSYFYYVIVRYTLLQLDLCMVHYIYLFLYRVIQAKYYIQVSLRSVWLIWLVKQTTLHLILYQCLNRYLFVNLISVWI